jgi:sugar/nucleoside kinase (ribokinase family)
MKGFDVVGFGALNMDKLYHVNKIAHEDDESYITSFSQSCGGSAANTILGLSRLGLNTGFIGKVSGDDEGTLLIRNLKREGVNTRGVMVSKKGRTGIVLGFVDSEGQRALYVDPGVNDQIEPQEIKLDYFQHSKILHLTSFIGKSKEAQEYLLEKIPDIQVSLDPGRIYVERGIKYLKNILDRTSIILINEVELKYLTGNKYKQFDEGAKILLDQGIKIVVVKRGDKGCYVTDGAESHYVEPFKVKCVDTTGAGDAFNAGYLYGFIKGKNLKESCRLGNYIASCCIQKPGASRGFKDINKLKDLV